MPLTTPLGEVDGQVRPMLELTSDTISTLEANADLIARANSNWLRFDVIPGKRTFSHCTPLLDDNMAQSMDGFVSQALNLKPPPALISTAAVIFLVFLLFHLSL